MPRERVTKTLSQDVLVQLRGDILSGRIEPGARLKMADLTSELSVSLSVLREALNRLVEQGLVLLEPQVGFRVMPLSCADLADLTVARVAIEGAACRESVLLGDRRWEADLLSAHHMLSSTPMSGALGGGRGPNPDWIEAHRVFHECVVSACGSRRLQAVANSLRDSAELYRQWSAPLGMERSRDVAAEHRGIMEAALARDVDLAVSRLTDHIQLTTDLLLESVRAMESADRAS